MSDTQTDPDKSAKSPERDVRRDSNPRRELVREQLMEIAARMFDQNGFDRVSMAMIAREVGLGRSAIYHYFASKDDILASLVESEALAPVGRIQQLAREEGKSATERLSAVVYDGVVRRLSFGSRFVRLARLEAQIPEHLRQDYDRSRRAIYDEHLRVIEEGIASGEFRPVDAHIAAFGIIGMANWTTRWYRAEGRLSAQEVAEAITDLALNSVRVPETRDDRMAQLRARLGSVIGDLGAISDAMAPPPSTDP
ncbi:TetR/AcrR family transcriptional regulator [Thalassorhabdomicrobium marinisediminis]|uniref:TetR/AcrR family transcriptional regulator n=1 Tax=Thalassorhabdomicrobium marinisediminis TaxID=2170577 RepID=A0A2T7FU88_9RHOB|nr:TetR/AcrR family transcriptional regulator [Thalassorhabdomicrobium marinisediminis]PVA05726.1 TetR/AcrR family transcriptional regulator [Thalassorhabdomicrobium marinisediminis]